jgi:hypothetical protein
VDAVEVGHGPRLRVAVERIALDVGFVIWIASEPMFSCSPPLPGNETVSVRSVFVCSWDIRSSSAECFPLCEVTCSKSGGSPPAAHASMLPPETSIEVLPIWIVGPAEASEALRASIPLTARLPAVC